MREFKSELYRVSKMTKSKLDDLPTEKHPDFFLTDTIPFSKTVLGKFHEINGFAFSLSFLLSYYAIEKKGIIYFVDGFSEFMRYKGLSLKRDPLLLHGLYGFFHRFKQEDFFRKYPEILRLYINKSDPIEAFYREALEFDSIILNELSDSDRGKYRPTGVFGLDYSFVVSYHDQGTCSIGRLQLIKGDEMEWT